MTEGWYPDPLDPTRQRYWHGDQWGSAITVGDGAVSDDGLLPAGTAAVADATADHGWSTTPNGPAPWHAGSPVSVAPAGPPVPVRGWWMLLVIAALSVGFVFLPQTADSSGYGFEDYSGNFDWNAAWPFFVGIAVLVVGASAGKAGRIGLCAIAAGAALYMGVAVFVIYSFVLELMFAFDEVSVGPGLVCALAACAMSVIFAVLMIRTSWATTPRTTPFGYSIIVSCASGGVAILLLTIITDGSGSVFGDSAWVNVATLLFVATHALNIVWPVARSNAAALGLVGGYTSLYSLEYVIALADGTTSGIVGDSAIGGLAVITAGTSGIVLALVFDRVHYRSTGGGIVDHPARSVALVVVVAILAGSLLILWAVNQTSSSESWEGSCANSYSACEYGDDQHLDTLWDACAAGDGWSCDQLYYQSPVGSEYEYYGNTCGRREPEGSFCTD